MKFLIIVFFFFINLQALAQLDLFDKALLLQISKSVEKPQNLKFIHYKNKIRNTVMFYHLENNEYILIKTRDSFIKGCSDFFVNPFWYIPDISKREDLTGESDSTISIKLDSMGRMIEKVYTTSIYRLVEETWKYDTQGKLLDHKLNKVLRDDILFALFAPAEYSYKYDSLGNVIEEILKYDTETKMVVSYVYEGDKIKNGILINGINEQTFLLNFSYKEKLPVRINATNNAGMLKETLRIKYFL